MISISTPSLKQTIYHALHECRLGTLKLIERIDRETLCAQPHPDFSPVGWHLGHIAFTEAYWLLEECAGYQPLYPEYRQLFTADGLPKNQRVQLPSLEFILEYLSLVRTQVIKYLETAPIETQERLWRFIVQHESQHGETIAIVLQLYRFEVQNSNFSLFSDVPMLSVSEVEIPAGELTMGNEAIDAMDNERRLHSCYLDQYWIDTYPVTCGQYRQFIEAGGYHKAKWWSNDGWEWLKHNHYQQPLYWTDNPSLDNHPVCGVSWYEAEAYCNFVGKRLPIEAEWEKAASWDREAGKKRTYPWGEEPPTPENCNCNSLGKNITNQPLTTPVDRYSSGVSAAGVYDLLGNVWEWTSSNFMGYEGFEFYPYRGYSETYFDNQHKVLRGGSWITRPWAMRCSFRNWYYPHVREIFAGFRCARSNN
ncbi:MULTISPECIES: SUMF1/EgtB/PvdO family nonheme iron enzyme [Limnospira]|uniref:Ergothioneine biosynthesis protein EgtB n=1 Tax=Limnospira indica PCC 8005 TaxID=376219 RepID=A0A9P1NX49_9CYAN|nr:SUMF1/EgtB/PvdO family nonheme iron enzyme [Limnospira indica]CDM93308.1 conserved protein of unknown function [Limnospira indica PCC 8005]